MREANKQDYLRGGAVVVVGDVSDCVSFVQREFLWIWSSAGWRLFYPVN